MFFIRSKRYLFFSETACRSRIDQNCRNDRFSSQKVLRLIFRTDFWSSLKIISKNTSMFSTLLTLMKKTGMNLCKKFAM